MYPTWTQFILFICTSNLYFFLGFSPAGSFTGPPNAGIPGGGGGPPAIGGGGGTPPIPGGGGGGGAPPGGGGGGGGGAPCVS